MQIDFTIIHSRNKWQAFNEYLQVSADTLEELDQNIKTLLVKDKRVKKGDKVKLFMAFDNAAIPEWIRQYSQHYFNRIVEFEA